MVDSRRIDLGQSFAEQMASNFLTGMGRKQMYKNILIATDGSELSSRALAHGLTLAKELKARVTVVNVTELWSAFGPEQLLQQRGPLPAGGGGRPGYGGHPPPGRGPEPADPSYQHHTLPDPGDGSLRPARTGV